MGKILSQEEIDALLGSPELSGARGAAKTPDSTAITYNFRRPDRVSKEQVRSLQFLHDRFARNVSTSLSAYLRTVTEVAIVSVEQFTYSEFLMSLPDPTAFYGVSLHPADGLGALELNPSVAFAMIDRMLGGTGQRVTLNRGLTEIEQHVVDAAVKVILENLSETWASIGEMHFRISGRETRPQMLQIAAPTEAVILLVFDIRVGEARGMLNLCIPTTVIEAFGASFTQGWYRTRRPATREERQSLIDTLGRVPMRLSAVLDSTLSARELLELRPGDVVSLGIPVREPIKVRIGAIEQFIGTPATLGANAALTVVESPAASGIEGTRS